jgi:hypothetical protein
MRRLSAVTLCYDSGNARNRFQRSDSTSMLLSAQCLLFPSATILFSRCMSATANLCLGLDIGKENHIGVLASNNFMPQ